MNTNTATVAFFFQKFTIIVIIIFADALDDNQDAVESLSLG